MQKSLHTTSYAQFRELLKTLREEAGLTQIELAERLNVGQDFISKTERGVRRLDVVELRLYCHGLGVPFTVVTERLDRELPRVTKPRRR